MEQSTPKICKDCQYEHFEKHNGNPNRYYCVHPVACKEVNAGARMISRTERNSEDRKHKKSPKWCPFKKSQDTFG